MTVAIINDYESYNNNSCDNYETGDSDESPTVILKNRNSAKKLKHVITPEMTSALDRAKISTRNAMHIVATTIKSVSTGDDAQRTVLNRETLRKTRIKNRLTIAREIKESFTPNCILTVHWDGKMMDDLSTSSTE